MKEYSEYWGWQRMSRINAIRIANLNYNNNAIHIDDEIFELGLESTLFSLRNGGGKSVLVQMMSAPFVRKRYRDTKDRPFESYFTSNRPTYILVEWALDGNNGYVLTGLMVRRSASQQEQDNSDTLDTVQFIYEYENRNGYDLYQFPLVAENSDGKKLLGFGQAKQLFEDLKRDFRSSFNFYDMNLPNQSRSYFEKLKEYGINHKEWESIIKKINVKESGLSELFAEAKDESGLVEKWFLPAVEDKLSKEENRIDRFVELIQKYIHQYKENRSNFSKKETINLFKDETKILLELANTHLEKVKHKEQVENHIANLIALLKRVIHQLESQQTEMNLAMEQMSQEITRMECAQIAYDIYLKEDECIKQQELLKECNDLLQKIEVEQKELNLKIKQYECSKVNSYCIEAKKEVISLETKLNQIRRKEEDLTPERNNLGYSIYCYYKNKVEETQDKLYEQEELLKDNEEQQEECTKTVEQNNVAITKYAEENGTLKSNIKSYGQAEVEFNVRYKDDLSRNIVGTYEENLLCSKERMVEVALNELEERKKEVLQKQEETKHLLEELEHKKSELQIQVASAAGQKELLLKKKEEFERLLHERIALLTYVELSEADVFDTAKIITAFEHKIDALKESQKQYVVLEEKKSSELEKLKSGKVLELPKEIEDKLKTLDINYVYGMDWIKNNGLSKEENQAYVKANPFIPFAMILGSKDYEKLSSHGLGIHTSFPIPIVKRENIELEVKNDHTKLYSYPEVSFYVSFNDSLLDKAELEHLVELKTAELDRCKKHLQQLQEEIQHYEDKKNIVIYERITKDEYNHCEKELKNATKLHSQLLKESINVCDRVKCLRQEELILVGTERSMSHSIEQTKEKQEELRRLMERYVVYLKEKERSEFLSEEMKRLRHEISSCKLVEARCKTRENELRKSKEQISLQLSKLKERLGQYEIFSEGELLEQSIEEMEARFHVITKQIYEEESQLEEQLKNAKKLLEKSEHELKLLIKEYQFESKDYDQLNYDMEIVLGMKKKLEQYDVKRMDQTEIKGKITNELTRIRTLIQNHKEMYEKKSGSSILMPRQQLLSINFVEAIRLKVRERQEKDNELSQLMNKLGTCKEVLSSMSEYEDCVITESMELHIAYSDLKTMRNEKIKEYRLAQEEVNQCSSLVMQEISRLLRNNAFAEDYYHKPLEAMEKLYASPDAIIEQLTTTIAAYDQLLEKLSIDLQMIEEEGKKVLEILLQYIQEVHENLGKIDRNSNITIRDRNIKMLKILLPNWQDEKRTYEIKCQDYLEHLVNRALELLDQNRNIEELVASYITTKNLYHQIVGIGNIGIRLYKIEEEREYPITWAEVSKNSGGEGFLSAFVILSSLLSYMRRDDTDLFNDKDTGKVLIMDNPFAQTNAAHLLIPLMDIAKKSNTQLICLSGLGGESIYNRFDNIYVLNLVTSKIKESMQYLYGEHIKGDDLASIVTARIQVKEEQMVLF